VSIAPSQLPATRTIQPGVVEYVGDEYSAVVSAVDLAAYVVIESPLAPQSFGFDVRVDGEPAQLEKDGDGVLVRDNAGTIRNRIAAPWALDANGAERTTSYSIVGSTVVQHVDIDHAAFPVVADPRLQCDGLFCTIEYKRGETQTLSNWGGSAATLITAGCGMLGGPIAGVACGPANSIVMSTAASALSQKKCFGMRAFIYVPVPTTHPVVVPCYA
jgi:hypothetical protein